MDEIFKLTEKEGMAQSEGVNVDEIKEAIGYFEEFGMEKHEFTALAALRTMEWIKEGATTKTKRKSLLGWHSTLLTPKECFKSGFIIVYKDKPDEGVWKKVRITIEETR
jgi:ribosomal protein S16